MLSGKYRSLDTIVEKVYRDYGFNIDIDWNDIAEWVAEIIGLIDAPMAYKDRITDGVDVNPIVILNGKGELPCDLYSIKQTRTCEGIPLRYTTDSFHRHLHTTNCPDLSCKTDLTYSLNDNYIFTNFKEGKLEMSYYAFMTDENGYPMIPDHVGFIEAISAHVAERIAKRLLIQGKMAGDAYKLINQNRDWYVGQASNAHHIPNRDRTESIKNAFVRLVPDNMQHYNGYKGYGRTQIIKNHNL